MKKQSKIFRILVILLAVTLSGLIALAWYSRKTSYDWAPTFSIKSKEPYGVSVARKLMEKSGFSIKESYRGIKKDGLPAGTTYFFIGESCLLTDEDWSALVKHVEQGGQAVIVSNGFPSALNDHLLNEDELYDGTQIYSNSIERKEICASMDEEKFEVPARACYDYKMKYHNFDYRWSYAEEEIFNFQSFSRLGSIESGDRVNYFSYAYGKGHFIFHLNPLLFTNYHLLEFKKRAYFQNFLKPFSSKNIYWDTYSMRDHSGGEVKFEKSPLTFIMESYPLRNAWYLFLLGILLFFLFGVKRLQRPIPVLPVRKNSTLEFLKVLAQLFFRDNNNKAISTYLSRSFIMFVRKRYNINLDSKDSQHVNQLQSSSGVDLEVVDSLLFFINFSREPGAVVTEKQLLDLNKTLNYFYKNCL